MPGSVPKMHHTANPNKRIMPSAHTLQEIMLLAMEIRTTALLTSRREVDLPLVLLLSDGVRLLAGEPATNSTSFLVSEVKGEICVEERAKGAGHKRSRGIASSI